MLRGVLVVLLVTAGVALAQRKLLKYNVNRGLISVSGISSGACMATQMHVAYSSWFMGAGLVAGTPYWCAKGSTLTATGACSSNPNNVAVSDLVAQTNRYASSNDVDGTGNLRNDRVFIFAGNQDSVVVPGIASKVLEYYQNYVNAGNIRLHTMNAEHTFPTDNYGNACGYEGSPFMGRCSFNGAYEILNHIYPGLARPGGSQPLNGDFYEFDQRDFFYVSLPAVSSMDNTGYVYVPSGCVNNQNSCRLHVAFHGCQQGRHLLGNEFALQAGYNQVGELNNIIILYPQAIATGVNPLGCWDWWGYTINAYATKGANQPLAVFRMVEQVS
jgi:predicted esterase